MLAETDLTNVLIHCTPSHKTIKQIRSEQHPWIQHGLFIEKDEEFTPMFQRMMNVMNCYLNKKLKHTPVEAFVKTQWNNHVKVNKLAMVMLKINGIWCPYNNFVTDSMTIDQWNKYVSVDHTRIKSLANDVDSVPKTCNLYKGYYTINFEKRSISLYHLVFKTFMDYEYIVDDVKYFIDHQASGLQSTLNNQLCQLRLVSVNFNNQNRTRWNSLLRTEIDFSQLIDINTIDSKVEENRLFYSQRDQYFITWNKFCYYRHPQFNEKGNINTITSMNIKYKLDYGIRTDKAISVYINSLKPNPKTAKDPFIKPISDRRMKSYIKQFNGMDAHEFAELISELTGHHITRKNIYQHYKECVELCNNNTRIYQVKNIQRVFIKGTKLTVRQ